MNRCLDLLAYPCVRRVLECRLAEWRSPPLRYPRWSARSIATDAVAAPLISRSAGNVIHGFANSLSAGRDSEGMSTFARIAPPCVDTSNFNGEPAISGAVPRTVKTPVSLRQATAPRSEIFGQRPDWARHLHCLAFKERFADHRVVAVDLKLRRSGRPWRRGSPERQCLRHES